MENQKDPPWLNELKEIVSTEWLDILPNPNSAIILTEEMLASFDDEKVITPKTEERRTWELIGVYYRATQRWQDALGLYTKLYNLFLEYQTNSGERIHKGMPLVWIADCYYASGFSSLSKRYLMLTLIEDAITSGGTIDPVKTGVYFRLSWKHGLPNNEINDYARQVIDIHTQYPEQTHFPEWVLQELDQNWLVEIPSPNEASQYITNTRYIDYLFSDLGEPTGKILERLAEYILSCMPGCRTARRQRTDSTDYDIVCSIDGIDVDFRSEFGSYFVCECKDWTDPVDFSSFAKFCRVLDSVKSRFGIIFSRHGITGENQTLNAEREQLKVFQDRGMVIIVVNQHDIEFVAKGGNFLGLLRKKYEKVRLDLV